MDGSGHHHAVAAGEVDVWRIAIPKAITDPIAALLAADEVEAVHRFHHEADAVRYAARHAALRTLLGQYLQRDPRALVFDRTCAICGDPRHGKPHIAGCGLDFSLSSSGELAVIAIARALLVGVDVQALGTPVPADHVLGPGERADSEVELLELWCRKEAVLKLGGHGLAIDPRDVAIAEDGSSVDGPGALDLAADARLVALELPPTYIGALATHPAAVRVSTLTLAGI